MKMNFIIWISFAVFTSIGLHWVAPRCVGAESGSYTTPGDASGAPTVRLASVDANGSLLALKLQASLLRDLAQEHSGRAAKAALSNQVERVKWETELAKEYQDKSARLLKAIDQMNNSQNATEKGQAPPAGSEINAANGATDEETEFLVKLESKRLRLSQELSYAMEQTRVNMMELATNNLPENLQRVTRLEEENQRFIRSLQEEQFDLDLKRLEYRAIRGFLKK